MNGFKKYLEGIFEMIWELGVRKRGKEKFRIRVRF